MKSVIGIDPGSKKSAYVLWNNKEILDKGILPNEEILVLLDTMWREPIILAIETMQSIHEKSGKAIIDTIFWSGQFYQAWLVGPRAKLTRDQVKKALYAKDDFGVRKALTQRFGEPGTKKNPGPITYGLADHLWAAFAVAVVHMDNLQFKAKILD